MVPGEMLYNIALFSKIYFASYLQSSLNYRLDYIYVHLYCSFLRKHIRTVLIVFFPICKQFVSAVIKLQKFS
jgi:hypothetical protein